MPWLLDVVYPFITTNQAGKAISGIASAGGVVAIVVGLVEHAVEAAPALPRRRAPADRRRPARRSSSPARPRSARGVFALDWARRARRAHLGVPVRPPRARLLRAVPAVVVAAHVYRNRLRGAFVTSRDKATAPRALSRDAAHGRRRTAVATRARPRRRPIGCGRSASRSSRCCRVRATRRRPVHLVCCSVARTSRRATGRAGAELRRRSGAASRTTTSTTGPGGMTTTAHSAPTAQWVAGARQPARARQAEGTLSAAISVSGAAVAPAMGRLDKGSTQLPARPAQPAPRHLVAEPAVRARTTARCAIPWVRLSYLLKEIIGYFDANDHHVYVTDGGHRENLGLVELLRRRLSDDRLHRRVGRHPGELHDPAPGGRAGPARGPRPHRPDRSSARTARRRCPTAPSTCCRSSTATRRHTVIGHGTVVYVGAALFAERARRPARLRLGGHPLPALLDGRPVPHRGAVPPPRRLRGRRDTQARRRATARPSIRAGWRRSAEPAPTLTIRPAPRRRRCEHGEQLIGRGGRGQLAGGDVGPRRRARRRHPPLASCQHAPAGGRPASAVRRHGGAARRRASSPDASIPTRCSAIAAHSSATPRPSVATASRIGGRHPRRPVGELEHRRQVVTGLRRAVAVGLVDHEHVGDLHQPGLAGLHRVAPAGVDDDHARVGPAGDVHLHLADADGLDDDPRPPGGGEDAHRIRARRAPARRRDHASPSSG